LIYKTIIVFFVVFVPCCSDALLPLYLPDVFTPAVSCEKIFTSENIKNRKISIMLWGGAGIIWPYLIDFGFPAIPSAGIESALETRYYPLATDNSKLFFGIYTGVAFMFPSYYLLGSSIGCKVGHKFVIKTREKTRYSIEPYCSFSTSPVFIADIKGYKIEYFYGNLLTVGIRFVHDFYK
jgi:hypothetical protein